MTLNKFWVIVYNIFMFLALPMGFWLEVKNVGNFWRILFFSIEMLTFFYIGWWITLRKFMIMRYASSGWTAGSSGKEKIHCKWIYFK